MFASFVLNFKIAINSRKMLLTNKIYSKLSETVVGQDNALKVFSIAIAKQLTAINHGLSASPCSILLAGPSGCGKSYIAQQLSQILSLPMVTVDAKSVSEVGYTGGNVDDIFRRAYYMADQDIKLAERSIIFIDELDKLKSYSGLNRDISGTGVQHSLLKPLDGIEVEIEVEPTRASPNRFIRLNTRNMLFIFAGAFVGLSKRDDRHQALEEYGLISELVNRFSYILELRNLQREDFHNLLQKNYAELQNHAKILETMNLKLEISDHFVNQLINDADQLGRGVRGLNYLIKKGIANKIAENFPNVGDVIAI